MGNKSSRTTIGEDIDEAGVNETNRLQGIQPIQNTSKNKVKDSIISTHLEYVYGGKKYKDLSLFEVYNLDGFNNTFLVILREIDKDILDKGKVKPYDKIKNKGKNYLVYVSFSKEVLCDKRDILEIRMGETI